MASDGHAKHKLVIFDSAAPAPATMGGDTIRFHGVRATDTDDAIDHFAARRQVRANACLLYTSPSPRDRQKSRMPSSA